MLSLNRDGATYRTKLMSQDRARSFARCLEAHPAFTGALVEESSRSRGKFLVRYVPANPARRQDMVQSQADARTARAEEQVDNYMVIRDPSGRFYWVLNLLTGDTYETTLQGCDCPDFTYRCEAAGILCKHSSIVKLHLERDQVQEFAAPSAAPLPAPVPAAAPVLVTAGAPAETDAERTARVLRNRAKDFPED